MIYPIVAYGSKILKNTTQDYDLSKDNVRTEVSLVISNMIETMNNASGVGLAGPQVNIGKSIFVIDTAKIDENNAKRSLIGTQEVFINSEIIKYGNEEDSYEEGCLSIPLVYGNVIRPTTITIRYTNADFKEVVREFSGFEARVIQHEYDHIKGILFVELLSPLKKQLIKKKLEDIKKGKFSSRYKMVMK